MKVSVIIPAYNPGAYLIEAIDSIYNQSYKNFEIIIVDDYSKEDLSYIIKRYPKITLLRTDKNLGPAGARNLGIRNSIGELISFLDADDIANRERLFWSVQEFEKDSAIGMVCGNYQIIVNRTKILSSFYKKSPVINWDTMMRQNLVASGSVTIKRKVIDEIGLFDERFWIAEDYDLWLRCAEKYRIKYIPKVLYYYSRITRENSSLTTRKDIQENHIKNLKIIKSNSEERVKAADAIRTSEKQKNLN